MAVLPMSSLAFILTGGMKVGSLRWRKVTGVCQGAKEHADEEEGVCRMSRVTLICNIISLFYKNRERFW